MSAGRSGELGPDALVDAAVLETSADLRLTVAFLRVLPAARSGHGCLSLGALVRVLPMEVTAHAREKRLQWLLENPRPDPRGVTGGARHIRAARH